MAGGTQRDDVLEVVSVGLGGHRRLHERSDRHDMVDVRVPAEVLPTRPADDALVVVTLESLPPDPVPLPTVVGLGTALPVRVSLAGERFREPRVLALVAAEDVVTVGETPTTSERGAAFLAFEFPLATGPAGMILSLYVRRVSPLFLFDARTT